jgi:hypothetical protein
VTYSLHLVDDGFFSQENPITLIYQDQRGSLFFLAVDQGDGRDESFCDESFLITAPISDRISAP